MAGKTSKSERKDSRESFRDNVKTFSAFSDIVDRGERTKRGDSPRLTMVVEADPRDIENKRKELPHDVIVEPEALRMPASIRHNLATAPATPGGAGIGATFELTVRTNGSPLSGVKVTIVLNGFFSGSRTMLSAVSDNAGRASIAFDPFQSVPIGAVIIPKDGCWSWMLSNPRNHTTVNLPALPKTGPLGWWHRIMGVEQDAGQRGEGIRIGVLDTGVGPHPYLDHVTSIGSFVNGYHNPSPSASLDVQDHGTHVTGIIAARPPGDSGDFVGIAPAADVFVGRVYPSEQESGGGPGGANQGDVANGIDTLAYEQGVDLINLSLGGPAPSQIELDAILAALERGTLTICSAGNDHGAPIQFPAAYPQTVSVSAIGVLGVDPAGSVAAASVPSNPNCFANWGMYLANFSSVGPQMTCTGPGVGIISTVPGDVGAPYADMSGTSMSSPAVCARLATLLSKDAVYRQSPRDISRAMRGLTVLGHSLHSLGLNPAYQGGGLPFSFFY
jgi:hypothetical protein